MFAATSKTNKESRKNAVNRSTEFIGVFIFFCLSVVVQASLSVSQTPYPVDRVYFYETTAFGITNPNRLTKYTVTGQCHWSQVLPCTEIKEIQIAFNRLFILDTSGNIECRDAQFGYSLWKSSHNRITCFSIGYPYWYAQTEFGDLRAFDFNTGIQLYQGTDPRFAHIERFVTVGQGQLGFLSQNVIYAGFKELTELKPVASLPSAESRIVRETDAVIDAVHDNQLYRLTRTAPFKSVFAFGLSRYQLNSGNDFLHIPVSSPYSDRYWIVGPTIILEISPDFLMIKGVDPDSFQTVFEWKDPDSKKRWTNLWWQNGLLAIVDNTNKLGLWNASTRQLIGSVDWPQDAPPVIGMTIAQDVVSFVTAHQFYYALSRRP